MNPADNQFNNESVRSLTGDPIIYCKEGQELRCNGDIDYLLQHQSNNVEESFIIVGETSKYQFILYKTFPEDSGYILKRENRKHHRLFYFRPGKRFNIVYSDHLFQAWESGPIKVFSIVATSIKKDESTTYKWFSTSPRDETFWLSNDEIKQMSLTRDGKLDILVHRIAAVGDYPPSAKENNYEMDYHLMVNRDRKGFKATPVYTPRQEAENSKKTASPCGPQKKDENPRVLNNIIRKIEASAVNYSKNARIHWDYSDRNVLIKYKCDSCGKNEEAEFYLVGADISFIQEFREIAAEFTKLGCPSEVKCYCKECADKYYPATKPNLLNPCNRLVFSLARGDSRETIISFPANECYRSRYYRTALNVLRGVDTLKGLAEYTNIGESSDYYLSAIHYVLGGVIDPAEKYIPRQETVIEKETHNIEDTIKDTIAKPDEHETLRKTTSVRNETSSRTLPIGIILKKLADSSVNYSPSSDDDVTPTPKKGGQVISYNCDKCGKAEKLIIFIPNKPEKPLFQHYKDLAQEFTESGCPTSIQCLCNNCANKYYPTTYTYRNFLVFTVNREDAKEAIESLPAEKDYDDFDYRVALEAAKGVATIQELSAVTNTHYSAERYLEAVHRVLGNATESIDECLLGQEEMKVDVPTDSGREGKSASETRTAFIADSLTNDKTNEIKTQSEKRQDVRPIAITGNIESFMDYKCASAFIKHYKTMLDIAQKSSIPNDSEFELLPAMFVVSDYAAASAEKDRVAVSNAILKAIKRAFPAFDKAEFDERCSLYGEIIRGKELRCEWYMGDASVFYENAILKCSALLGDILYNPSCADDYDDAPESLYDIVESFEFTENVMDPLIDEFVALFKDIYDA